jgi:hypothetical protein
MYIKVTNGAIEKYPYSIGELRKANPNTSFPKKPSDALLAEWGVFPVKPTGHPSYDYTKNLTEGTPANTNGEWVQTWVVTDASAEEIANRTNDAKDSVRAERDAKLAETDWLVVKHLERNENIPGAWEVYRQALRDVPQQPGFPENVVWPDKP